jgi:putative peptidoglycan lipid II flippase
MPHEDVHHRTLVSGVRTIFSVTLLSRFAGMARDVMIGRIFGNTAVGSAFLAAFQFPNLFRRLFGEGALSAAFIPSYTEALRDADDPRAGDRLATLTLAILGSVTAALTVIGEVGLLILLLSLPRDPDRDLSLKLIMVVLPYMPLICAAAILAGILQVHGRYGPASAGPVMLNAFVVVVGGYFLVFDHQAGESIAFLMSAAIVLSGVTQCMWFLRVLRDHVKWTMDYAAATHRARLMLRRFVPVAIGLGTLQLNTFVDTLIAMYPIWVGATIFGAAYPLNEGSNSVLSLTTRLYQFPLGVFGIAVATAVFPLLARTADEPAAFVSMLRRGLRLSLFIGLPASVGLILIRRDITFVMFSGGKTGFDAVGAAKSAAVLFGHAVGIWAYSLNHVFARAFYAKGDTLTPMKVAMGTVAINFALNLTLIWPLAEAGMAWATSIAAMAQCVVLGMMLRRRLGDMGSTGTIADGETVSAGARIVMASAVMGAATYGAMRLVPAPVTWSEHLVSMVVGMGAGTAAYAGLAVLLRMRELKWLLGGAGSGGAAK